MMGLLSREIPPVFQLATESKWSSVTTFDWWMTITPDQWLCLLQLPHMTPYIRFCSCQLNASNLIQYKTENDPKFREMSKVCGTHQQHENILIFRLLHYIFCFTVRFTFSVQLLFVKAWKLKAADI